MARLDAQSKTDYEKELARTRVRISKQKLLKAGVNQRAFVDGGTEKGSTGEHEKNGRKLRKDVLDKLFQRGALDRIHVIAAQEIERAWRAIHRQNFSTSNWREFVDEQRRAPDILGKLQGQEYQLIRRRFAPWLFDIHRHPIIIEFSDQQIKYPNSRDIVMEILADNLGPSQADRKFGIRKGASQRILRVSLDRYCSIAGFAKSSE